MSKTKFAGLILSVVLVPSAVFAGNFGRGGAFASFSIPESESRTGDVYASAGSVAVAGSVEQDLTAAGGTLLLSGAVGVDALLAGGNVSITGDVGDDIRAAGGSIILSGENGGDVLLMGGQITIAPGAVIGGSLRAGGGSLVIEGPVGGQLLLAGGDIYINSVIGGNAELWAESVTLGPQAVINGNLKYHSKRQAVIAEGARITGQTEFIGKDISRDEAERPFKAAFFGFFAALIAVKLLMKVAGVLLLAMVLKKTSFWLVNGALHDFWHSAGKGFAAFVLMPVSAVLLAVTVIGIPVGFLLFIGFIAWCVLSFFIAPLIAGAWLYRKIKKTKEVTVNWKTALLGIVALGFAGVIPFVGWAVQGLVFMAALGMLVKAWYTHIWLNR